MVQYFVVDTHRHTQLLTYDITPLNMRALRKNRCTLASAFTLALGVFSLAFLCMAAYVPADDGQLRDTGGIIWFLLTLSYQLLFEIVYLRVSCGAYGDATCVGA